MTQPRYVETDEDFNRLIQFVCEKTKLENSVARDVFWHLKAFGYRIQKPFVHPSKLDTTEEAITVVVPHHGVRQSQD